MIEVAQVGGAECGALSALAGPAPGPELAPDAGLDPALMLVTRRWPTLTGEQRLAILEIVATASGPEPRPEALRVVDGATCDGSSSRPGETYFRRMSRPPAAG
jgi:hypothetical protein